MYRFGPIRSDPIDFNRFEKAKGESSDKQAVRQDLVRVLGPFAVAPAYGACYEGETHLSHLAQSRALLYTSLCIYLI